MTVKVITVKECKDIIESGKLVVIAYANSLEISPALEEYSKSPSIECYHFNLKDIAQEQAPACVKYQNGKILETFMGTEPEGLKKFLEVKSFRDANEPQLELKFESVTAKPRLE